MSQFPNRTITLIGNPNCGKTTLFNALTGAHQRVGNWSGVTVEKKSGMFRVAEKRIEVVDLPGILTLNLFADDDCEDERLACEYILSGDVDIIVNVVDATHLERNLYLTTQLMALKKPMVVVVSMLDVARKQGIVIDLEQLRSSLGCPVIGVAAHRRHGINQLKQLLLEDIPVVPPAQLRTDSARAEAPDVADARARYDWITSHCQRAITQRAKHAWHDEWLDNLFLNRVIGIPLFFVVMYTMFLFAINIGGAFQDFFDLASAAIFIDGMREWLSALGVPAWLNGMLSAGVGKGINTTVSFIPVIGAMFFFLSFLEGSGYMARAAFVMDRLMRALGLPGKAFVPLIVGFGCNVPAIMATRTLAHKRDRILTIMMSPFMSCGARLAIFAVFVSAFFPQGGHNIVFALYLIGISVAVLTGLVLRRTVLRGESVPMVMELPPYHLPTLQTLCIHTWSRLKNFIFKAGKLIIPLCVLIGTLNAVTIDGRIISGPAAQDSILSAVGKTLTPLFKPMGIKEDNWPATVGLATGVMAKEVVVATLNTLYTEVGHLPSAENARPPFSLKDALTGAIMSIPQNFGQLKQAFLSPVAASAKSQTVRQGVYGQMVKRFDGAIGAFAYLLFILLYFPCVSATAAIARELNRSWALFSVCWSTGLAYLIAVCFYQSATVMQHLIQTMVWVGLCGTLLLACILIMNRLASSPIWEASPSSSGACGAGGCHGCGEIKKSLLNFNQDLR